MLAYNRPPDFAPSSETPDVAPSSKLPTSPHRLKLREATSGKPESYVGQAGRLRRAGCPRIRPNGLME
jgi:hypothetical protein